MKTTHRIATNRFEIQYNYYIPQALLLSCMTAIKAHVISQLLMIMMIIIITILIFKEWNSQPQLQKDVVSVFKFKLKGKADHYASINF